VIIAVVVAAIAGLARTALTGPMRIGLAVIAGVLALAGINELVVLLGAALAMAAARGVLGETAWMARIGLAGPTLTATALSAAAISLPVLFGTFLKIGAVLYGSGYVLIAFLRADFVERLGWLTDRQLFDAVAVGQVTPGPLFSTATFVGYLVAGPLGAVLATVAIFLPAFVYVAVLGGVAARLRQRPLTAALLDGVTAGALGLMAAVTLQLAGQAIVDWFGALLAAVAAVLVLWGRVPSVWLIVGGGLLGLATRAVGLTLS
jgi:chromate transporter